MNKPRVLYLVGSANYGGVESFIKTCAQYQTQKKIEAHYYFLNDGPLVQELQRLGARVTIAKKKFRIRNFFSYWSVVFELKKIVRTHQINIIHSSMAYCALLGSSAAMLARCRHVWFQHGPVGGWMDWLAAYLYRDLILFNSKFTKSEQLALHSFGRKFVEKKSRIVLLGTFQPAVELRQVRNENIFLVVFLGRAQAWKGVDIFIEAIKLARANDARIKGEVYLADTGDAKYNEILKMSHGKEAYLTINQPTMNVSDIFLRSDCVVNASRSPEPFGLTLIEAMSFGVVPVAPRSGGPVEIIEDGTSGLLFEPCNAVDLSEKILALSKNSKLCEALSRAAVERYQQIFTAERMGLELENIYSELILTNC